MIERRCSFFVVSAGKLFCNGNRACAPNTENVPVPVRSALNLPCSITCRSNSRYWIMPERNFNHETHETHERKMTLESKLRLDPCTLKRGLQPFASTRGRRATDFPHAHLRHLQSGGQG